MYLRILMVENFSLRLVREYIAMLNVNCAKFNLILRELSVYKRIEV